MSTRFTNTLYFSIRRSSSVAINDSIALFPVHCSPDQRTVQYMTVLLLFATPNFLFLVALFYCAEFVPQNNNFKYLFEYFFYDFFTK